MYRTTSETTIIAEHNSTTFVVERNGTVQIDFDSRDEQTSEHLCVRVRLSRDEALRLVGNIRDKVGEAQPANE